MKNIMWIVCTMLLFSACKTEKEKTTEQISVDAIPVGTMAICRIKQHADVSAMLEKSMYMQCFDSVKSKSAVSYGAVLTRDICGKKYSGAPMTIAVGAVRAKELSFIFMIETGKDAPRTAFGADTTITHRSYEEQTIYTVTTKNASLHFYNTKGMTICSTDELYLEQSLLQTASGISIAEDASFSQAYKNLSSGDGFTVIVNLPALEHFYSTQLGFSELGLLGQLSPWVSAEVSADSTTLSLNGVFCASDSVKTYAKLLANQKSKEMTLDAFFPSNTTSYTYLGVNDWKKYFKENIQYLKASSQYHLYNVAIQRYNIFFGSDFDKFFTPWIGKGAAVVRTSGAGYDDTQNSIFIGVQDHEEAMAALEKIADSTSVSPDPYLGHRIIVLGQKSIFSDIISSALGKKGVNYATVMGDVMICSYNDDNLKNIMDDITDGTTLTSISEYREQKATLPSTTHMMSMVRADLLNKDMAVTIKEKRKIYPIVLSEVEKYFFSFGKNLTPLRYNFFQTSSTGSTPFMNFKGVWSTSETREASKAWAFSMQGAPSVQTIAFPNHRYGGFDVLCADATGMLYFLSEKGSLYWKKKLPTAVSSPFVVVDLYNNKKYQMAFYAGSTFYVIDRNGNPVTDKGKIATAKKSSPMPSTAKISSTNEVQVQKNGSAITVKTPQSPVSTAQYSSTFDIILYSIENGKIYACDTKGTAIAGFPLPAAQYYTVEDFAKNGKMEVVTTSTSGSVTMYRMPKTK